MRTAQQLYEGVQSRMKIVDAQDHPVLEQHGMSTSGSNNQIEVTLQLGRPFGPGRPAAGTGPPPPGPGSEAAWPPAELHPPS